MSTSQYYVRTTSRRFPTRSDSTDDFLLAVAESGLSPSRGTSPSNTYRRQVARSLARACPTNPPSVAEPFTDACGFLV